MTWQIQKLKNSQWKCKSSPSGTIEVKIPENWHIRMDVLSMLGDIKDGIPRNSVSSEYITEEPDVMLQGS